MKLFESVPNFSEGRDAGKIQAIANAGRTVPGVTVLDVEQNPDHHRSVMTLVGEAEPLVEALIRMMRVAIDVIDLNEHRGEHPRMGAVDVVPFVPLGEASTDDAVHVAEQLAKRTWQELQVPVYLYGLAARRPERSDLAVVRKGEFEGIRTAIATDPDRRPDVGDPAVHPTAGIVAIGARPVLIAYNAYLTTPDVAIAKKIARAIRGRDGGLTEVKALGFTIAERQLAQVSMNLTDYRKTPVHRVLELVRREAARYGVGIEESEIVGLVPEDALLDAAEFYLQLNRFDRSTILERKLMGAAGPSAAPRPLRESTIAEFSGRVAERSPTPGGGSVAAVAAALGAALGEMVLAYSQSPTDPDPDLATMLRELTDARRRLLLLIDEDAAAYEAVRSARSARKGKPEDPEVQRAVVESLRHAAEVPLRTARMAFEVSRMLESAQGRTKAALASDLASALALLTAARVSAVANVGINLVDLRGSGADTSAFDEALARLRDSAPR
ncbi:MAG: glutamate formimidoyltransferase [Thermoplasmata archaeon]